MIETSLILAFIAVAFAVWADQTKPRVYFDDERSRDKSNILKAFREAPNLEVLKSNYKLITRFHNKYRSLPFTVWDDVREMQREYEWKRQMFVGVRYSYDCR